MYVRMYVWVGGMGEAQEIRLSLVSKLPASTRPSSVAGRLTAEAPWSSGVDSTFI